MCCSFSSSEGLTYSSIYYLQSVANLLVLCRSALINKCTLCSPRHAAHCCAVDCISLLFIPKQNSLPSLLWFLLFFLCFAFCFPARGGLGWRTQQHLMKRLKNRRSSWQALLGCWVFLFHIDFFFRSCSNASSAPLLIEFRISQDLQLTFRAATTEPPWLAEIKRLSCIH